MTTETTPTLGAHAVRAKEGEAIWWFGALAEIKATAADTGGLMTILEITEPPDIEVPLHVHYREDEEDADGHPEAVDARIGDLAFARCDPLQRNLQRGEDVVGEVADQDGDPDRDDGRYQQGP